MENSLSKSEFKKQYSMYRKTVSSSMKLGRESFCEAIDTNKSFKVCLIKHVMPVSVKIWLYLNKRNSNLSI